MSNLIINDTLANDEWTLVRLPASQIADRKQAGKAVSYTHLDVYKRQIGYFINRLFTWNMGWQSY